MRILCLTPALSMRTFRQMKALADRGHQITLLYLGKGGSVQLTNVYRTFERCELIRTLKHPLYQYRTTLFPSHYRKLIEKEVRSGEHDLIHSCSMPDVLAAAVSRYASLPKVYDVRDMVSAFEKEIQLGNYLPQWTLGIPPLKWIGLRTVYERLISLEREATLNSNARIYVSEHTMELARRRYNIPEEGSVLFYNYAMRSDLKPPIEKLSDNDGELHIVYEGVLSDDGYRGRMLPLFETMAKKGIHIHIHGIGSERTLKAFKAPQNRIKRYHFEGSLPHEELMTVLTRYDAGMIPFLPYGADRGYMDTMLPNKLFDYLAAGLCLLVPPTRSMQLFVSRTGTGLTYRGVDDLPGLDEVRSVNIERERYVIEEHISELEDLYRSIS
jgi:hypothetical protein